MAHCHVCGAETELTCSACGAPVCEEHKDQGGVCDVCWSEYGEWSAEQDEADREAMSHEDVYGDEPDDIDAEAAMEGEGMDDIDYVCEVCGCEVASEADLDDGVCEICASEGDDVLVDEDDEDYIPGEDMDGDHESALASAGFGTDEDYGCFSGGEDF